MLCIQIKRTSRDAMIRCGVAWFLGYLVWTPAIALIRRYDPASAALTSKECLFVPNFPYTMIQVKC